MSAVTKVQKFPWIVSRNSENCWISEMRTIQPKILEIPGAKLKGKKTAGYPGYQRFFSRCSGNFRCVGWAYLPRSSSFSKFWNYSLPKVAKNSHRTFWLNGKRPVFSVSSVAWAISVLSFYSRILEVLAIKNHDVSTSPRSFSSGW